METKHEKVIKVTNTEDEQKMFSYQFQHVEVVQFPKMHCGLPVQPVAKYSGRGTIWWACRNPECDHAPKPSLTC